MSQSRSETSTQVSQAKNGWAGSAVEGQGPKRLFCFVALAMTAVFYAALVARGIVIAGGFEYPLDDPYIHLALAEQIAQGTYGINPGEAASPSSSPLFPLLLTPFPGTEFQRMLLVFWNTVGMGLTAWLWGLILVEAGFMRQGWRGIGVSAAALGPIAMLSPHVGFIGMEHTLHAAATLAVFLGLFRHLGERGGMALLLAGVFFASAFRLEGAAIGVVAGSVLFFTGDRRMGVLAVIFAFLPIVVFSAFLLSAGLEPLPSSVSTKLSYGPDVELSPLALRLAILRQNILKPGGALLLILAVAALVLWRFKPASHSRMATGIALVSILPVLAHLALGQIGWANRYEHYVLALSLAGVFALIPMAVPENRTAAAGLAAIAMLVALVVYQPQATLSLGRYPYAIAAQQGQMSRLVQDHWKGPIGVNDIGLVSWQNQETVLDLWGLAFEDARKARLEGGEPGWAGDLTDAQNIDFTMVYDKWFKDGIGPDWIKIGDFVFTDASRTYLGDYVVAFYATRPEAVDDIRLAVAEWVATLRKETYFDWEPGMAPE